MMLVSNIIKRLHPAYFALVMGVGIISIDAKVLGLDLFSLLLMWVDFIAYIILLIFFISRILFFKEDFISDLYNPLISVGYFTFVAGSGTLGSRFLLSSIHVIGLGLFIITFVSWSIFNYLIWLSIFLKNENKITLDKIHGGWFLTTVGTQSTSIITTISASFLNSISPTLIMISLTLWSIGVMLYVIITVLIMARLSLYKISPSELVPSYWINFGAGAISTFAGFELLSQTKIQFISDISPFLLGISVLLWGWETWWYVIILAFGFWRHFVHKYTLKYDPLFWSAVFVSGMYTRATIEVNTVFHSIVITYLTYIAFSVAIFFLIFTTIDLVLYPSAR